MKLTCERDIHVRFNEVDSLGILWHGHFIKYFEDGREAFGAKYNLGYMDVFSEGYVIPLVDMDCSFKVPIKYGDKVRIEATFVDTPAAKIIFDYKLYNPDTSQLYATGRTVQVFLTKEDNQLHITLPEFYIEWKKKRGLLPE